jgi:hypothetical protein
VLYLVPCVHTLVTGPCNEATVFVPHAPRNSPGPPSADDFRGDLFQFGRHLLFGGTRGEEEVIVVFTNAALMDR